MKLEEVSELANGCPDCVMVFFSTPHLGEAVASTSMESPKSSEQLLREFLGTVHDSGHDMDKLLAEPT